MRAQSPPDALRWLILASLGLSATSACGGRSLASDEDALQGDDFQSGSNGGGRNGGAGGRAASPPRAGNGGNAGSAMAAGGFSSGGTGFGGAAGAGMSLPRVAPTSCEAPVPLGGGAVRCNNGMVHRPYAAQCPANLPRAQAIDDATLAEIDAIAAQSGLSLEEKLLLMACRRDQDCTEQANGYCQVAYEDDGWFGGAFTHCSYGCASDLDCGDWGVCDCRFPAGQCVPASCGTDSECGGDLRCTQLDPYAGCGFESFAWQCQTSQDECLVHADCSGAAPYCTVDGNTGVRSCQPAQGCPVPGRPFLVGDGPRLANAAPRADWLASSALALEPVHPLLERDAALRSELAQAWTEIALMEHASVASFARFALQLMSLGAPPELLAAATTAMLDETRHAQVCFALARRYGGEDVGPGNLSLEDALSGMDKESIVLSCVREGCIGETVAALEASAAAEHCVDEPTRLELERIAREESQHAELAWRFVAWALRRSPVSLAERVRETFADEARQLPARSEARATSRERELLAFGIVTPGLRLTLRQRAFSETVLPCAHVLLEQALAQPGVLAGPGRGRNDSRGPAAS